MQTIYCPNEKATLALGRKIAHFAEELSVIYLLGDLGAGKTTLVRGILDALNVHGFVKSPSYTIVEPYTDANIKPVFHFDLYRIHDPEELEFIGLRDYIQPKHLCLFEWPEHGGGLMPVPDLVIRLSFEREGRQVELEAQTDYGRYALEHIGELS